jgi:hypothetical protein
MLATGICMAMPPPNSDIVAAGTAEQDAERVPATTELS